MRLTLLTIVLTIAATSTSACTCGKVNLRTRRIVNGQEAKKYIYPWLVSLNIPLDEDDLWSRCSGSLINDRYILTSATCLYYRPKAQKIVAILGAHNESERWNVTFRQEQLEIDSYKIHEGHKLTYKGLVDDIALIKLKKPIEFDGRWSPICLPEFSNHSNLFVYGWGAKSGPNNTLVKSNVLNEAAMDEVDGDTCVQNYWHNIQPEKRICAGIRTRTCYQDSGSPLSTMRKSRIFLVGIASSGTSGCGVTDAPKPSLFERVTGHLDWIEDNTEDALWCSGPDTPGFTRGERANWFTKFIRSIG